MKIRFSWRSGFLDLMNRVKIRKSRFEDQVFLIWKSGFTIENQGDQDQVEIRKSNLPKNSHFIVLFGEKCFSTYIFRSYDEVFSVCMFKQINIVTKLFLQYIQLENVCKNYLKLCRLIWNKNEYHVRYLGQSFFCWMQVG